MRDEAMDGGRKFVRLFKGLHNQQNFHGALKCQITLQFAQNLSFIQIHYYSRLLDFML